MKSSTFLSVVLTTLGHFQALALFVAPRPNHRISLSSGNAVTSSRKSFTQLFQAADQVTEVADAAGGVDYYAIDSSDQNIGFGDFSIIASQGETGRNFVPIESLGKEGGPKDGDVVWIRGRVSSVRAKGNACFMVLRSGSFNTVQACHFKDKENPDESKKMIKYVGSLTLESIVDIMGVVVAADVKSCSVSNVELQIKRIYAVGNLHNKSIETSVTFEEDMTQIDELSAINDVLFLRFRKRPLRCPSFSKTLHGLSLT
jgi:lysyl-tRNA synthetase class II